MKTSILRTNPRATSQAIGILVSIGMSLTAKSAAPPTFAEPASLGTINVPGLVEASGLVVSRNNKGVYWSHNDKGGEPLIYAFAQSGEHLGTYHLQGATAVDYEDMAVGPGPVQGVDYLYVGDIGDGNKTPVRTSIQIYRVPEPAVYLTQASRPVDLELTGITTFSLVYPDGPRNAETILADPLTGDIFVIPRSSAMETVGVYRATAKQLLQGGEVTMTREGTVSFAAASGGGISPTGLEIVLRQESFASLWTRQPGQSIADALAQTPQPIPVVGKPAERNGEAIAFDAEGSGYFTVSDSLAIQPLLYFARTSFFPGAYRETLVSSAALWRYYSHDEIASSTNWFAAGFDDASWAAGVAPLGFGRADIATFLDRNSNTGNTQESHAYFRARFNAKADAVLELRLLLQGGARVYLNGAKITEFNLVGGTIDTSGTLDGASWAASRFPRGHLINGVNVVAIDVLQSAAAPSLLFDAQIVGWEDPPSATRLEVQRTSQAALRLHLESPATELTLQTSPDLMTWDPFKTIPLAHGRATLDVPILTKDSRFFRAARDLGAPVQKRVVR